MSKGSTGDGGSTRLWLEMRLHQGVHHTGASPNQTISVFSQFLVPEGKEDEALELVAYFSGGE